MAQSIVIKRISAHAERLYNVRREIERIEEEQKKTLEGLKAERDTLQGLLINDLNEQGLSSFKLKSGDRFTKAIRRGVEIVDDIKALTWAIGHHAVNINKVAVGSLLRQADIIPEGFKLVETEYISVAKAKK